MTNNNNNINDVNDIHAENEQTIVKKDNTIRNVDMRDYIAQKKSEMVQAYSEDNNALNNNEIPVMKPKTSRFEPDPLLFRLPSGGVTIPKRYLTNNDCVYLRRITTKEEDMIFNFLDRLVELSDKDISIMTLEMMLMMDNVIDSCLKTNIPVSELSVVDREAMFNFVVALAYGEKQTMQVVCEECGTKHDVKFNLLQDPKIKYLSDTKIPYPLKIQLENDNIPGLIGEFRHLKIGETKLAFDKNLSQTKLFETIVLDVYDEATNEHFSKKEIHDIMENLSVNDRSRIKRYFDDFSTLGLTFKFDKKLCNVPQCANYNKKIELSYSLQYLIFDVIKLRNAII